nr:alpha/beta hydrolase [Gemmatimonadaceae bacterium]
MFKRFRLVTFTLSGTLAACGGAVPAPARNGIQFAELTAGPTPAAGNRIAYGSDSLQFGELRLPSGRKRVPVIVLLHGGCWRAAYDMAHLANAAHSLSRADYATWTIEYRRVGNAGGGWPGTFADVAQGLDFTRQLANRFPRLDTTRIVIVGHSAGGQLALWAASRKRDEKLDGIEVARAPIRVAGVLSLAGITDLRAYASGPGSCNRSAL